MKVFSAARIRAWDEYTITHQPITSIQLMEKAAEACTRWITNNYANTTKLVIFCGNGNNGGDGLAIARLLLQQHYSVHVYCINVQNNASADFFENQQRLPAQVYSIITQPGEVNVISMPEEAIIIDCIFGTGLNRPPEGIAATVIDYLNSQTNNIISVDLPSGLYADASSKGNSVVHASYTLSFQCYKAALLVAENSSFFGETVILDIGLSDEYYKQTPPLWTLTDKNFIQGIYKPRKAFSHKGSFGHAVIMAGSKGKTGAALLAADACLRSGAGLLSCYLPSFATTIMHTVLPEAMVIESTDADILTPTKSFTINQFAAAGIGPGIGTAATTALLVEQFIKNCNIPCVLDADALNIISENTPWLQHLPQSLIITPHPREFDRLFGACENDFERIDKARENARSLNIVIVLKGHKTIIALADGTIYLNNTGNAGMATGGSGDVLTGIITGLLSQGYTTKEAALLGVYLHGSSGDIAAAANGQEALIAGDIVRYLGKAFLLLNKP